MALSSINSTQVILLYITNMNSVKLNDDKNNNNNFTNFIIESSKDKEIYLPNLTRGRNK